MASEIRQVVLPTDLAELIDQVRGDVPFSRWMRRAAIEKLEANKDRNYRNAIGTVPPPAEEGEGC